VPDTTLVSDRYERASEMPSPPATRLARVRWLDLRLLVGVLLVLGSVLLGTKIIAGADDTTAVLALTRDVQPGVRLTTADVTIRRIRLDAGHEHYVAVGSSVAGYIMTRPALAGELLPRRAVATAAEAQAAGDIRWITIAVPSEERPEGLSTGQLVDVWIAPDTAVNDARNTATLLASRVAVDAVANSSNGLSGARESTVTLAMRPGDRGRSLDELVGELVAAARDSRVYLTVIPGRAQ
jgi:hypothetical protein